MGCGRRWVAERQSAPALENVQYQHADFNEAPVADADAAASAEGHEHKPQPFIRPGDKVGRNDPCPCGSGKKYKQCHGKLS